MNSIIPWLFVLWFFASFGIISFVKNDFWKKIIYPANYSFIFYWIFTIAVNAIFSGQDSVSTQIFHFFPFILGGLAGILVSKFVHKVKPDFRSSLLYVALILSFDRELSVSGGAWYGPLRLLAGLLSYLVFVKIFSSGENLEKTPPAKKMVAVAVNLGLIILIAIVVGIEILFALGGGGGSVFQLAFIAELIFVGCLITDMVRPWIPRFVKIVAGIILALVIIGFVSQMTGNFRGLVIRSTRLS